MAGLIFGADFRLASEVRRQKLAARPPRGLRAQRQHYAVVAIKREGATGLKVIAYCGSHTVLSVLIGGWVGSVAFAE